MDFSALSWPYPLSASQAAAMSTHLVRHDERVHRPGADKARTHIGDDIVTLVLHKLTKGERSLVATGSTTSC